MYTLETEYKCIIPNPVDINDLLFYSEEFKIKSNLLSLVLAEDVNKKIDFLKTIKNYIDFYKDINLSILDTYLKLGLINLDDYNKIKSCILDIYNIFNDSLINLNTLYYVKNGQFVHNNDFNQLYNIFIKLLDNLENIKNIIKSLFEILYKYSMYTNFSNIDNYCLYFLTSELNIISATINFINIDKFVNSLNNIFDIIYKIIPLPQLLKKGELLDAKVNNNLIVYISVFCNLLKILSFLSFRSICFVSPFLFLIEQTYAKPEESWASLNKFNKYLFLIDSKNIIKFDYIINFSNLITSSTKVILEKYYNKIENCNFFNIRCCCIIPYLNPSNCGKENIFSYIGVFNLNILENIELSNYYKFSTILDPLGSFCNCKFYFCCKNNLKINENCYLNNLYTNYCKDLLSNKSDFYKICNNICDENSDNLCNKISSIENISIFNNPSIYAPFNIPPEKNYIYNINDNPWEESFYPINEIFVETSLSDYINNNKVGCFSISKLTNDLFLIHIFATEHYMNNIIASCAYCVPGILVPCTRWVCDNTDIACYVNPYFAYEDICLLPFFVRLSSMTLPSSILSLDLWYNICYTELVYDSYNKKIYRLVSTSKADDILYYQYTSKLCKIDVCTVPSKNGYTIYINKKALDKISSTNYNIENKYVSCSNGKLKAYIMTRIPFVLVLDYSEYSTTVFLEFVIDIINYNNRFPTAIRKFVIFNDNYVVYPSWKNVILVENNEDSQLIGVFCSSDDIKSCGIIMKLFNINSLEAEIDIIRFNIDILNNFAQNIIKNSINIDNLTLEDIELHTVFPYPYGQSIYCLMYFFNPVIIYNNNNKSMRTFSWTYYLDLRKLCNYPTLIDNCCNQISVIEFDEEPLSFD